MSALIHICMIGVKQLIASLVHELTNKIDKKHMTDTSHNK